MKILLIIALVVGVLLAVIHELYLYRKERSITKKYKDITSFLNDLDARASIMNKMLDEIIKMLAKKLNSKN